MSSNSNRFSIINGSGIGEQDQDANSALTELDKGLRSVKVGEQCEAIVRFPRLFARYPFPILINSACLKLGDVFRFGSNFLRVLIFKVMQQSQKHLDKILNIDEFVRRIYSVIHSNDPVARAMTLRTLGSIASVVAEKKDIHHSIRNSLDSHDAVELEAAIYASGRFAAQSKTFASNICPKIGEMIQGLATPVEIKLKLLTVFQQMHHDAQTTSVIRNLCIELLPSYSCWLFTVAALHTLTQLAADSIIDISEQVELLLKYLHEDPRQDVKFHALQDLMQLAEKGSHLWLPKLLEKVVEFALETPYLGLKCNAIKVLVILASSYAVDKFEISADCKVLQLCEECIYHTNSELAAISIEFLTYLAIYIYQEDIILEGIDLTQEVSSAIESLLLIISTGNGGSKSDNIALKRCLRCTVKLCEVNPDLCTQFVDTVGSLIGNCIDDCVIPICETLCALGNKRAGVVMYLQPELVNIIIQYTQPSKLNPKKTQALVMMCTLLFQANVDYSQKGQESQLIMKAINSFDLWSSYRVARQATRYGHHEVAAQIFSLLCNRVSSEHFHFWLMSLWEISEAENCLQHCKSGSSFHESLSQAITHYSKAVSGLKAATSPLHSLLFQCDYIKLRSEFLQAHLQLLDACSCIKTSPPPAIAAAVAIAARDELQKSGRVVTQLRKCAKEFRGLAEQYGVIYQSVFDADPKTLSNIQILQQSCLLSAQAIERLVQHNHGLSLSSGLTNEDILNIECALQTLENQKILDACRRSSVYIRDIGFQGDYRIIGRKEIDSLLQVSHELALVPLCLPRLFYQTLQSTSIKLAISPQPKVSGDPIYILNTAHLAIKVEGVVQHGTQPGLYRKVSKVTLFVSSILQSRSIATSDFKMTQETSNSMTQTVTPHNDYFHAQFLLAFSVPGLHLVTVEATVIDETEAQWKTGPKMTLTIKSHDDNSSQKASRSTFGTRF